jgi:hypothetical protein
VQRWLAYPRCSGVRVLKLPPSNSFRIFGRGIRAEHRAISLGLWLDFFAPSVGTEKNVGGTGPRPGAAIALEISRAVAPRAVAVAPRPRAVAPRPNVMNIRWRR